MFKGERQKKDPEERKNKNMAFTSEELILFLKENKKDAWVELAKEYTKCIIRHTQNSKETSFLSRIESLETAKQKELRDRFFISNKHIISSLQRPADNIWTARGGSFFKDLGSESEEKSFLEILSKINSGNSIYDYLKEQWFEGFRSNPCGGSFITIENGEPKEVSQISINQIKYIERYGTGCNSILFEAEKIEETKDFQKIKFEKYLYIDEEKVLVVIEKDGKYTLESEEKNIVGFVPFEFNSYIKGIPNIKSEHNGTFLNLSPLNDELQLLDAILRKNSTKEIHEFLHAYPVFWRYVHQCPSCRGFGKLNDGECPDCGGLGIIVNVKKDVSTAVDVFVPQEGEQNITPPAGYITPPVDIIAAMREEITYKYAEVEFSHWGVNNLSKAPENPSQKTATQIVTDLQPTINRLNDYSQNLENHHNSLLNIILRIIYPATYKTKKCYYAYGRGYVIETADTAMERYLNDKNKGASQETLNYDLINYYASRFRTDEISYERAIKMMRVEPFVHISPQIVLGYQYATEDDKKAKVYFNEWRSTITGIEIDKNTPEKLRELLYKFVETKIIENGKETNGESGGSNPGSTE